MNTENMEQVISCYIKNFAMINDEEHQEYYKWQICHEFPFLMDEALNSSDENFPKALYKAKACTSNIIDSFTQPFYGLVKFAEEEPATVKQMFKDLYAPDNGDLNLQMKRIETFINCSNELLEKYYPGSYLYKQNSHSVSSYLFLYDPEHHYMYKANECNTMANCIEFYDSWGSGDNIKLDVFYRMCDEMIEYIKKSHALLTTNQSRYDGELKFSREGELHPDLNKHILLFDIIYCSRVYSLFDTISFSRPNSKEKKLLLEYKNKAQKLKEEYDVAKELNDMLNEAIEYFSSAVDNGDIVNHKKYGQGTVTSINGKYIYIKFSDEVEEKQFGLPVVIANGILSYANDDFEEKVLKYKSVLAKAQTIPGRLDSAAKALKQYEEYL